MSGFFPTGFQGHFVVGGLPPWFMLIGVYAMAGAHRVAFMSRTCFSARTDCWDLHSALTNAPPSKTIDPRIEMQSSTGGLDCLSFWSKLQPPTHCAHRQSTTTCFCPPHEHMRPKRVSYLASATNNSFLNVWNKTSSCKKKKKGLGVCAPAHYY